MTIKQRIHRWVWRLTGADAEIERIQKWCFNYEWLPPGTKHFPEIERMVGEALAQELPAHIIAKVQVVSIPPDWATVKVHVRIQPERELPC